MNVAYAFLQCHDCLVKAVTSDQETSDTQQK